MMIGPTTGMEARMTSFTINGRRVCSDASPASPLSQVLREEVGLTSVKIGCGEGECGSCSVLLDGDPVNSCLVRLGQADGSMIETVEAVAASVEGRALQNAFLRCDGVQCGFCTPGMLVAALALLRRDRKPSRAAIATALEGVLCRCTGYTHIIDAVVEASEALRSEAPAPGLPDPRAIPRLDALAKLNGKEAFGDDKTLDDPLYVRVIRSPHHRAAFEFTNIERWVEIHEGIEAVLTARDVPGNPYWGVWPDFRDQPVFADGITRFRGEAVAAIVGSRTAVEQIADSDLLVSWTELPAILTPADALEPDAHQVSHFSDNNILTQATLETDACLPVDEEELISISARISTGFVEHAYLEPEAGYCIPRDGRLVIGGGTQSPYADRTELAGILALPEDAIRISPTACGGAFGGKLDLSFQPYVALAALKTGRPTKCTYTRSESFQSTPKRHPGDMRGKLTVDRSGRFLSYEMTGDFDTGAYASAGPTISGRVPTHAAGPYRIPAQKIEVRTVYTNNPPSGAFRGFGVPQSTITLETLIEDAARQLPCDPLDLRLANALREGDTLGSGQELTRSVGIVQCLETLRPSWRRMRKEAARANREIASGAPLRRGVGIASLLYGSGAVGPNPSCIKVALTACGRFELISGAADMGQGATTVLVQIAAEALRVPVGLFDTCLWDTDLTPDAGKSSASRQTFVSGKAAELAALDLRHKLLTRLNASENAQIELSARFLSAHDASGTRSIALRDLHRAAVSDRRLMLGEGHYDPNTVPLGDNLSAPAFAAYAMGALIAVVDVDIELGTVAVRNIVSAIDAGKAINPRLVTSQVHGGIAQGLGMALMEEYLPGRTESFADYLIPTIKDMPEMQVHIIESANIHGPFGAKGIGEAAPIPVAPAILNAIRHATGARLTQVPARPDRVLAALEQCA